MNDESMYDDYNMDDYDEEETVCYRSPDASVKRYRDERYIRKVSNVLRSHYRIFCPYGHSHAKRYALWQAMKSVGWRGQCRRGWYDPMFIKKLQNARVRYTGGTIPRGNHYRKITRRCKVCKENVIPLGGAIVDYKKADVTNASALP